MLDAMQFNRNLSMVCVRVCVCVQMYRGAYAYVGAVLDSHDKTQERGSNVWNK